MFQRALISVSDKSKLIELGRFLQEQNTEIISTGGSAKTLQNAGIKVKEVSELTGFPEIMDGRVKTLHPKIHMGLLARHGHPEDQETLKELGGVLFDLVVVNLYPFEETLKKSVPFMEQVEQIDIGGPSMVRAACKSFDRITVLTNPNQYDAILGGQRPDLETRKHLAAEAFAHTSTYDALVSEFMFGNFEKDQSHIHSETAIAGRKFMELRYGENPHQRAWWYTKLGAKSGWQNAEVVQGKELSYNNILDLDAAQNCLSHLQGPACVVVKHNNPCGVATAKTLLEATTKALAADPVSCFGGIVALNQRLEKDVAEKLSEVFLECVVAPEISEEALQIFRKKKNQRILIAPDQKKFMDGKPRFLSVWGGFLIQDPDQPSAWSDEWKVIGAQPPAGIKKDLELAWAVCASLKSNAIALASQGQTRGLGMGQVSRVDSVEQAIARLKKFHPQSKDVVAASDAFFPFADSIELLAAAGVKYVIQPGGSIKDEEVIQRAGELGVTVILTGKRHFRH